MNFKIFDKHKIAISKAFDKAAQNYNNNSKLQKYIGNLLMKNIKMKSNISILDAGCGTGWFSKKWKYYNNKVTAIDISYNMLKQARNYASANNYLLGDIESLPFLNKTFDISWSNLVLQWCNKFNNAINELCRVTKCGGTILFSIIEKGSLKEMLQSFKTINKKNCINNFLSINEIKNICNKQNIKLYNKEITLIFPKMMDAIKSIKKIGANYSYNRNNKDVFTKNKLIILKKIWPKNKYGYLLSYKIIFGIINI
ncbi:malonyl-ACP O-methyltransferase BioC [Candidatus Purcelliella pentastirinorum]|uniref:Malonyl-[acyl-carrier protein] O-methyltransferase n=1 Tax=Candidatus Purcelliella pentastirinorum TaxID=472834 RepID=A0AAX3N7G0_9ENTR|nr:malonyl-ACP O-methyltransferase BioC [Candidatus Purcelliella pentastirinorum]WDI78474.1 malonyl-ACP O-methyltransferase BioC [Candidatus Purcelliella pentastirinorum]WDR80497.1 malonyl-ACP O-methyltransferase BioC [Candidatus Purcelliella pentastirinorum]